MCHESGGRNLIWFLYDFIFTRILKQNSIIVCVCVCVCVSVVDPGGGGALGAEAPPPSKLVNDIHKLFVHSLVSMYYTVLMIL